MDEWFKIVPMMTLCEDTKLSKIFKKWLNFALKIPDIILNSYNQINNLDIIQWIQMTRDVKRLFGQNDEISTLCINMWMQVENKTKARKLEDENF